MMSDKTNNPPRLDRRNFLRIVAVAGGAGICWKLGLFGTSEQLHAARRAGQLMGTVVNLTVYGQDRDQAEHAVDATLATMQQLEKKLSRHMESSELYLLNLTGELANPSSELYDVLSLSQHLSKETGGAFDVTVLPLLKMFEEKAGLPHGSGRDKAKDLIGYNEIQFSRQHIRFAQPGMQITFDGIGKGYIVDQGVATLRSLGFSNVCVEAGGDLMVSGQKAQDTPWRIGLRDPRGSKKMVTIDVSDKAVATSGDYLQAFTSDLTHHHILDPRSGFSPPELASCTVTAPNVALADGLATALMVLGPEDGIDLIESLKDCETHMVDKHHKEYNSSGFFS